MSTPRTEARAEAGTGSPFDPFLLPTATAVRFCLLIMTAAVGSMYLGVWYAAIGGAMGLDTVHIGALSACASQLRADASRLPDVAVLNTFADCVTVERRTVLMWMIGLGPVWACLTLLVYAIYPGLLQRRLRPVRHGKDSGGVRSARAEVDAVLGDTRGRVELLTTPGTAGGARAFGAFGRHRIAVDGSLLVLNKEGALDERALAVIRHETAHLRNRDVDLTYAAMSAWWAFLVLTGIPLLAYLFTALALLATGSWHASLNDTMATLAVSVLALLLLRPARARVLRTREHYADVRAARTGRTREELKSLLSPRPSPRSPRRQRWWHRHTAYHPSHQARLDMLDAPWRLAEPSGVDMAIVGIALGAAHLHLFNTYTVTAPESAWSTGTVAAMVLAAPVGALVTAMVWNAVHAAPEAAHRWRAKAAALSGGMLLGLALPNPFTNMWFELLSAHVARAVVSAFVLWGLCLLFLKWATSTARAWLATTGRKRAACFAGLVCGAVVFGCVFVLWGRFHGKITDRSVDLWVALWHGLITTGTTWALPAAVGCASAFAFTGLLRRSPEHGPPLRPLAPVVAGCAVAAGHGGLLVGAMLLAIRQNETSTDAWVDAVLLLTLLLAAVVSVGLGVRSGGRGRHNVALCVSAVFVLVLLALQPAVFWISIQSTVCLKTPSPGCWGRVAGGLPTSYANALMIFAGLAVFLVVCGTGAIAGSWIRAAVRSGSSTEGHSGAAALPRGGRRSAGPLAAVAAAAIVLGTSFYGNFMTDGQRIDEAQQSRLRSQVEPATVSRESACDVVSGGLTPSVESSSLGLISYGYEAEIVALSSSTDPVLSAFGRAALDGATAADSRFFNTAILYCRTDVDSQR